MANCHENKGRIAKENKRATCLLLNLIILKPHPNPDPKAHPPTPIQNPPPPSLAIGNGAGNINYKL
jgi:hypothetical protein